MRGCVRGCACPYILNDADMPQRPRLPPAIWALGFVSLLMDVSSELIHSLLPVFMVTALGASALTIGLIEGAAEATALIVKVFSGALSDYFGRRKPLAILGYGLGALSKPLFALAPGVGFVLAARLIDRVGKGIRGAPRDALVADIAPPSVRGAAFGLRQSLDTVGAFLGPLLAIALMLLWANDFRAVFWVAVLPAALSVALLAFGVREPERPPGAKRSNPIRRENLRLLGRPYWWVVVIGAVFTLARFSEAFLVLRAADGGLPIAWTPLVLVGMNFVYALAAYPFGKLSDTVGHGRLLAFGLVVLIAADALLASGTHWTTLCDRHRALGPASGHHAGAARENGRRRRAGRAARHGLRILQPRKRHRDARRERFRRPALGPARRRHHVRRRCGVQRGGVRGARVATGAASGRAGQPIDMVDRRLAAQFGGLGRDALEAEALEDGDRFQVADVDAREDFLDAVATHEFGDEPATRFGRKPLPPCRRHEHIADPGTRTGLDGRLQRADGRAVVATNEHPVQPALIGIGGRAAREFVESCGKQGNTRTRGVRHVGVETRIGKQREQPWCVRRRQGLQLQPCRTRDASPRRAAARLRVRSWHGSSLLAARASQRGRIGIDMADG